jgi:hypothetical protein
MTRPLCAYCHREYARVLPLKGVSGTVAFFCSVICAGKAAIEACIRSGAAACSKCGTFYIPSQPCECEQVTLYRFHQVRPARPEKRPTPTPDEDRIPW